MGGLVVGVWVWGGVVGGGVVVGVVGDRLDI